MESASRNDQPLVGRRFILTIILGSVLPLGLIGLWTTRSAARSGRELLRTRLSVTLEQTVREAESRWQLQRSELMLLAENEPVRQALLDTTAAESPPPPFVRRAFAQMTAFNRVEISDLQGRVRWVLESPALTVGAENAMAPPDTRGLPVTLPITDLLTRDTIGTVSASVRAIDFLPALAEAPSTNGVLSAAFIRGNGSIVPPTVDDRLFNDEAIVWGDHHWLAVRRSLGEPQVDIAVAGALDPYVEPFRKAARVSVMVLLVAATIVVVAMVIYTQRETRSIEQRFAQREALAVVGEFAAELAHEVRNPLTAVRLDLQRAEEVANDPTAVRALVPRVLRQIERLDRAVSGALRVARTGSKVPESVDLRSVVDSAARAALPEFNQRGASLIMDSTSESRPEIDGDADALEQVFLNVLLNAAQSLSAGGQTRVILEDAGEAVEVTISDNGAGMTPAELDAVQQSHRSTKRSGTGLGLKIARRIVTTHRGEMRIESVAGVGTTIRVRLPARPAAVALT